MRRFLRPWIMIGYVLVLGPTVLVLAPLVLALVILTLLVEAILGTPGWKQPKLKVRR